jgi:hypothetical protein
MLKRPGFWSGKQPARQQALLILALALCTAGCSRKPQDKFLVSGEITIDGERVAEGHIALVPLDGSVVPDSSFFKEGKYSLLARPGEKRVEIRASRVSKPAVAGVEGEWRESIIPSRYNSQSQLTVVVQPQDANRFDFHLSTLDLDRP